MKRITDVIHLEPWHREAFGERAWGEALAKWRRSKSDQDMMDVLAMYGRRQSRDWAMAIKETMREISISRLQETLDPAVWEIKPKREGFTIRLHAPLDYYYMGTFGPHLGHTWSANAPTYIPDDQVATNSNIASYYDRSDDFWAQWVRPPLEDKVPYSVEEILEHISEWDTEQEQVP